MRMGTALKVKHIRSHERGAARRGLPLVILGVLSLFASTLPPAHAESNGEIIGRLFGTLKVDGVPANAPRPMLVSLVDFEDEPMPQNREYYDWLYFGEGSPNAGLNLPRTGVPSYNTLDAFKNNSYGRFWFKKGALLGPYRYPDDPRTTADENLQACVVTDPKGCPGIGLVKFKTWAKTSTGQDQFLGVRGGGGGDSIVTAASTNGDGPWEGMMLADRNGGQLRHLDPINLISYNGQYVTAENGGNTILSANRAAASVWEQFVIHKKGGSAGDNIQHGDDVALQVSNQRFVSALNGGGGTVIADRKNAFEWETFTLLERFHDNGRQIRFAMERAAASGFDFSALDFDNDGVIEGWEAVFVRVASTRSEWGQQGGYLPAPVQPPGSSVKLSPRQVVFDAFAGLDTIVHELAHAIEVEHVYGSNNNSANLTPMSGTVGVGQPPNQYDRATYHLDPWTKFRLGWLRPNFVRIDVPINACRSIAPTDRDGLQYTLGATQNSLHPVFLHHPDRVNEYLFAENRIRAGYDEDVASAGLVLWYIKLDGDNSLAEAPGQVIRAGSNGVLDSTLNTSSDDSLGSDSGGPFINPGTNRWLDSIRAGDDTRSMDPLNISLGAPATTARPYRWGGNTAWTAANGIFRPTWPDGTDTGLRIQVGQQFGAAPLDIEMAVNGPYSPYLATVSPSSGPSETDVTLSGNFGARGTKRITVNGSTVPTSDVLSWSCTSVRFRIRGFPGQKTIRVVGDGTPSYSSPGRTFTVTL
jgi:hypothetical protein